VEYVIHPSLVEVVQEHPLECGVTCYDTVWSMEFVGGELTRVHIPLFDEPCDSKAASVTD
jgi:hypothetical protein